MLKALVPNDINVRFVPDSVQIPPHICALALIFVWCDPRNHLHSSQVSAVQFLLPSLPLKTKDLLVMVCLNLSCHLQVCPCHVLSVLMFVPVKFEMNFYISRVVYSGYIQIYSKYRPGLSLVVLIALLINSGMYLCVCVCVIIFGECQLYNGCLLPCPSGGRDLASGQGLLSSLGLPGILNCPTSLQPLKLH